MKSDQIRKRFLDYFARHQHRVVPSSSVVPAGDPTLLFTNAGMVQFKDVFLGQEERPYRRAVTSQKCIRAGGKHNDLENVGFTARHLTFFEMLGNFSFGDYFKRDAIRYAHELLTGEFGLPQDRLWPTVFREDDEAFALWEAVAGYPPERIVRLDEKDNFWAMGDTGPCGPCSEIVLDRGEELACGPECAIGVCDCDRWLELWNLVFMQYNRDAEGNLTALPRPSVDTGMGLERMATVLQGKATSFDTDLFLPIIGQLEAISHTSYGQDGMLFPFRVVADHVRSCTFIMADGVLPANEGRGYVLRRILRRAVRYGHELGIEGAFLHQLVPTVVALMQDAYPDLVSRQPLVIQAMQAEEERFLATLDTGMRVALDLLQRCQEDRQPELGGDDAFTLYDTFGFPLDLTRDLAREHGLRVDEQAFYQAMEQQRTRARAAHAAAAATTLVDGGVLEKVEPTSFCGYERLEEETRVELMLSQDGDIIAELVAPNRGLVVLKESPFYALGGGQVPDQGLIFSATGRARVLGVEDAEGRWLHHLEVEEGVLARGQEVNAVVDAASRWSTARHHTATHLLHHALRVFLGPHVRQAGSLVTPERLRFDFTHYSALTPDQLKQVEDEVNALILSDVPVQAEWMDKEQAEKNGAVALFDEKYGQRVRVVHSGPEHRELCGGTHVASTGQVGLCKILSQSSVGAGLRRLEAVCGSSLLSYVEQLESQLATITKVLGTTADAAAKRAQQLVEDHRQLREQWQRWEDKERRSQLGELAQQAVQVQGMSVLVAEVAAADAASLRQSGDVAKEQLGESVVVLASRAQDRVLLLAMASPEAVQRGTHCGEIVKAMAPLVGGGGGGKAEMAQAGGRDPGGMEQALEKARMLVAEQLGGEHSL